jgi:hypothetical protein
VKCKFISSIGITCEYHPHVAHHFIHITGQSEGSLIAIIDFLPILHSASHSHIVVVVFHSQAGVGLTAVTRISFHFLFFSIFSKKEFFILAL